MHRSPLKIMWRLAKHLGSLSVLMPIAICAGVLGNVAASSVPVLGTLAVAKLVSGNITISYKLIALLAVLCGVSRGILRYLEQYLNHYIAFKLLATLRIKIFDALRNLDVSKLEDKKKGGLLTILTSDIETLEVFYAHTISPISIALITSSISTILIWIIAGFELAITAISGYLVLGLIVPKFINRMLIKGGDEYRKHLSEYNSWFLDNIKGIREIVMKNAGSMKVEEVNKRSTNLSTLMKKQNEKTSRANSIIQLIASSVTVIVLIIAILIMKKNNYSEGFAIIGFAIFISTMGPVIALAALPSNLAHTFASANRFLDLLDEKPSVPIVVNGLDFEFDKLEVNNLSFGYDEDLILSSVTFKLEKGKIIAIVGQSGSGKSTILKLLLRERDKKGGEILYNGQDVDKINTKSLLQNITLINQTTYLFDETIEYNLRIANLDASDLEITRACDAAAIGDFVASLENGYKTKVGMLGDKLSAGEKQRLGLARAFLRGSPVILLDEPTSNVDASNENIILNAIKKIKEEKAIIIVSHRESTAAIADKVYKLENGFLIETKNVEKINN
ncbi:MAG: ABC transporter ATP-binding protein/permease [Christensenellaceae bacterium]|nr:ABC transporter ATP-binding protein/permease [Christensenellaceae bacterium]